MPNGATVTLSSVFEDLTLGANAGRRDPDAKTEDLIEWQFNVTDYVDCIC